LDLVPIEAMVLVEARIFRGDDSMLKIGRDLTERNEFVAFAIRRVVSPSLQATLDVHCSGRWIGRSIQRADRRSIAASNQRDATLMTSHRTNDPRTSF
jgi:hypothetical protein